MSRFFNRAVLALFVAAPIATATTTRPVTLLQPAEAALLQERLDPALGSMRAGRIDGGSEIGDAERAGLRAAQDASPELAELRAGNGVGTVLAAVLIVLLILLLI